MKFLVHFSRLSMLLSSIYGAASGKLWAVQQERTQFFSLFLYAGAQRT
jgi:hypothetical protein